MYLDAYNLYEMFVVITILLTFPRPLPQERIVSGIGNIWQQRNSRHPTTTRNKKNRASRVQSPTFLKNQKSQIQRTNTLKTRARQCYHSCIIPTVKQPKINKAEVFPGKLSFGALRRLLINHAIVDKVKDRLHIIRSWEDIGT